MAKRVNTFPGSVTNWEKNRCEPELRFIPAIMDFLGYCPIQYPKTWSERVELYRVHHGFSLRKLARMMGVDPGALAKQMGRDEPTEYFWERFLGFRGN